MANTIEQTLEHAMFIARHLTHGDCSTVVHLVLYELGITPKNDGFIYLKRAITIRCEDPRRLLVEDIYIQISIEVDGIEDWKYIEQAIRRAIEEAWKECDEEVWGIFFRKTRTGKFSKPSNGDMIARVAWFVELWRGCCKEVEYANRA